MSPYCNSFLNKTENSKTSNIFISSLNEDTNLIDLNKNSKSLNSSNIVKEVSDY